MTTDKSKIAIVTGITGQDGRYTADLLVAKGYSVIGLARSHEAVARAATLGLPPAVSLDVWNMRDTAVLTDLLEATQPAEFYNFAAFSTGSGMFDDPVAIGDINGLAVTRILDAIAVTSPGTRFAQASSAEMYGAASGSPQDERSPFDPRSPYGAAKHYAHTMIGMYRRRTGLFGCSAILFNHESPRRPEAFVTRKVTRAAAAIRLGLQKTLVLGSLSARRDWGFAGDYVEAMWRMLQQDEGDDYVVATGETHSIAELCDAAFSHCGLDFRDHVSVVEHTDRAPEPLQLVGNPHKAARKLEWSATVPFKQLVALMVDSDLLTLRLEESIN